MSALRASSAAIRAIALTAALAGLAGPAHGQGVALPLPGAQKPAVEQSQIDDLRAQAASLEKHAAEWQAKGAEYEEEARTAPAQLSAIEAELARGKRASPPAAPADAPTDQLEVLVISAEQDLAIAQRKASDLETERERRTLRRRELPALLADAKARLAALPATPPPKAGADPALGDAQQRVAEQRRKATESELRASELELTTHEVRVRLLEARIAQVQQGVEREQARLAVLQRALAERRDAEATRAVESALASIDEAKTLSPELRDSVRRIAEQNAELARGRTGEAGVLASIDDVSRKLATADQRLNEVNADLERLAQKYAADGLTRSLGLVLVKTRSELPDVGKTRRFMRIRTNEIADVQAREDELRAQLEKLNDIDAAVDHALARLSGDTPERDRSRLAALLRDLFETRRKHLNALLRDYEHYFQVLVDYDTRQQQLVQKTQDLLLFIDQRILWVPSSGPVSLKSFTDAGPALDWLTEPAHWQRLGHAALESLREAALTSLLVAGLFAGSLALRPRIKRRLRALAEQAREPTQTQIAPTLEAVALSLFLAPWGALLLDYLGWRISLSPEATPFVRSMAQGLISAGVVWLTLEVPRQLLRRDGVAAAHFAWPEEAVAALYRQLRWLVALALPLVLLVQVFETRGVLAWRESVGRFALIALLLVLTLFTHRIIGERGSVRAIVRASGNLGLPPWIWRIAHAAMLAMPLALAVAAARGYAWTALQLSARYHLTLVFVFLLAAALQLALRWMLLARRRIAFEQWRAQREAQRAAEESHAEDTGERTVLPEPELDLGVVDAQTRRLLTTSAAVAVLIGLFVFWADFVPALGVLDQVQLWSTTETRIVQMTTPDGARQSHTEQVVVPITLARVIEGVLIGFMAYALARNLAGLLEVSLFRRWKPGAGERYAIVSITRYAITLVATVAAFNMVGVGWAKLQWLVAAIGLGLGFGLQEIFANFVSGLILLFERPIRVGDTVTVNGMSGTVSKIQIRATRITAFDRKELVVPNKEFVTNQLVNWSLTDTVLRVDIPVGIAYGSDVDQALRLLLEVAHAHEYVLADPKPRALFQGFGPTSMNLELRAYSPDVEHTLAIRHDLHVAIERVFREAGIPFPPQSPPLVPVPASVRPEPPTPPDQPTKA